MDDYFTRSVSRHPGRSAVIIATLIVIAVVLIALVAHYRSKGLRAWRAGFDGAAPPGRSACGPGETPVSYHNPDGSSTTYCRSTDAMPGPPTVCGAGWDPAASAEAEALATVGSLKHDPYGERRLGRAVNAAYDANLGLSDEQLASVMHQGGTP